MGARSTKPKKGPSRSRTTGKHSEVKDQSSAMMALEKVYSVLVDFMEPDPVLNKLMELGFPENIGRQIREEQITIDKNRKLLDAVRKGGNQEYQNLKLSLAQCGQEVICTLLESTEKGENTSALKRELRKKMSEYFKHYKDLKDDLITYYRMYESHIPASPLVDEHSVPIEDLYVLPTMWAYDDPYFRPGTKSQKGVQMSGNDDQQRQKITLSQLFLSGNNRYRKIYITANAGFGKTSLSKKLTMTWCQANSPLTSLTQKYERAELDATRNFDFLFLFHLRDYQNKPQCELDDLIMQMVTEKLSRTTIYTKEFVQKILHNNTCLIIFDGLDEWAHPGHCTRKPQVPHNNHPDSCTVLTTTRDWKIGTIGLSPLDIDRRVEISMLDDETRYLLENNAIGILNERNLNLAGKTIEDFDKELKTVHIGEIIYIPYILLQLMCLFFGGLPIGKSKCEVYSNITEFTLERGLIKKNLPDKHVKSIDNVAVPNSMRENATCKRYFVLLRKLGKLAFYTLFSEKRESSLIFDRSIVTQYMTEQEIEFCLKVGLLCQTKDSSIVAVKRYQVFFQHKSVQEFFSAIFITSEWQNESVKLTILKVCSSLSVILDMANIFVFVCGINPDAYTCISAELQNIVDRDDATRRYRTEMHSDYDAGRKLESYQSMQVQGFHESARNGNGTCLIHLYDIHIDTYSLPEGLAILKTIINLNKGHIKSLQLSYPENKTAFMQSLDPGVFTSLETLRVDHCKMEPVWLTEVLTESARTLKCLTISLSLGRSSLSDNSITTLTGLTCLQSLNLAHVHLTHSNLKCLYAYISQTTTLTQLKLACTDCLDHKDQFRDCDVIMDIHRLNELKCVELGCLSMPTAVWQNLLLSFGDLSLPVTVKLSSCMGPSDKEWLAILNVINTTPTLSLLPDFSISSGDASLTLKNNLVFYL